MKRMWSDISGMTVLVSRTERPIGKLSGVFINPETGQIIAFLVGYARVLAPVDIEKWGKTVVRIPRSDSLIAPTELLRLQEFGLKRCLMMGKVVYSKDKKRIGRLRDFTLDTTTDFLIGISVTKKVLWFQWDERIFPFSRISRIDTNSITLNINSEEKERGKERKTAKATATLI